MEKRHIEISTGIVFRTVLIILALWFLYLVKDIIALIFVAILIVSAIDPAVDWMQRKRIPRPLGVSIIYLLMFSVVGLTISLIVPPLASQFIELSQKLPQYFHGVGNFITGFENYFSGDNAASNIQQVFSNFGKEFSAVPARIFTGTIGIFSGFFSIIIILIMAFYMAVKEKGIKNFIVSITPEKHKEYAAHLTERIETKMGRWVQGQLLLMVIIFALDFIGLSLLKVPYALTLALLAGLLEIVPYVGPIISAIPGIILGFTVSPFIGLMTALLYFIAQEFESYVIVPQVMKKAVGLNPIAVIIAILIGVKLGGILGALLAVPVATIIGVVVDDLMKEDQKKEPTILQQ